VAVQISRMENGDGDGIGLVHPKRAGHRGKQGSLPEHPQEPAPTERGHVNIHEVRVSFRRLGIKQK